MMLRTRALVTSLIVAVPATVVLAYGLERVRAADRMTALERVVQSQVNAAVRERCESDPTWFMTGPLVNRPSYGVFVPTVEDQLEPRPRPNPQPFELYGYDEAFVGSGPATPRFPQEFRAPLRSGRSSVSAPHVTEAGTGAQYVIDTDWVGSKCRYLLGRLEAPPHQKRDRVMAVLAIFGAVASMSLLASVPVTMRIRRLARATKGSIDGGYTSIAPERLKDELSSLTFMFNDAMTELQQRKARIEDQDAAARRILQSTEEGIAKPIAALEASLGAIELGRVSGPHGTRAALIQAHDLRGEVEKLTAVTRLRQLPQSPSAPAIDLRDLTERVVSRHEPLAHARSVVLRADLPTAPIDVAADPALLECAFSNVVDNAIRYNREGGEVLVSLALAEDGTRFRFWVADNGPGVTEEYFRGLTAVRRFRGDESRNRRPGAPGLGLALAREVADRFGLHLDLKRPGAGGFEVEISGPVAHR